MTCEHKVCKKRYYGGARVGAVGMLSCAVFHRFMRAARGPFLTGVDGPRGAVDGARGAVNDARGADE